MSEPEYTVFIRVPISRGNFVDPAPVSGCPSLSALGYLANEVQVNWSSKKDEELWRILSGVPKNQIHCRYPDETVAYLPGSS